MRYSATTHPIASAAMVAGVYRLPISAPASVPASAFEGKMMWWEGGHGEVYPVHTAPTAEGGDWASHNVHASGKGTRLCMWQK